MEKIIIIGGGLAGAEAAWQIAQSGLKVILYEMRPTVSTGAHQTEKLAELICSNSLGSNLNDRASGVLKNELRKLNSLLLSIAEETAIPAGAALAVDRELFSEKISGIIASHPNIELIREEVKEIPNGLVLIASGPLTSSNLANSINSFFGQENLFFYDAISPIVQKDSIDFGIAYRASRWDSENPEPTGDYINCPFHDKQKYNEFVVELQNAERIKLQLIEKEIESGVTAGDNKFFEGCLPVEIIASRGQKALAYGPMRPVGLADPRIPRKPYAVVQLRQDNIAGSLFNLVGFQTNLTFSEQKRVFRLIPGLENAEFVRFGQMHRNTFICSPRILTPTLQSKKRPDLFLAGQITGVEGYMGNIATGLLAGLNMVRYFKGVPLLEFPRESMLGALCHYITHAEPEAFQPMKANFGLLPPPDKSKLKLNKRDRAVQYSDNSREYFDEYISKTVFSE